MTVEKVFYNFGDNICNSIDFIWRIYDDSEQQEVNLSEAIFFGDQTEPNKTGWDDIWVDKMTWPKVPRVIS